MTDDERLLIVQMALGKASVFFMSQPEGGKIVMPVEGLLEVANDLAAIWSKDVLERTGAQGRDQDVSDRLLGYAIAALENCRRRCDEAGCSYDNCVWDEMKAEAESVQRARAAEKETEMEARRVE